MQLLPVHDVIDQKLNYEITCKIDSSQNYTVKWLQIDNQNESTLLNKNDLRLVDYQIETNSSCSTLKIARVNKSLHGYKFKCIVNSFASSVFDELVNFESNKIARLNVLCNLIFKKSLKNI